MSRALPPGMNRARLSAMLESGVADGPYRKWPREIEKLSNEEAPMLFGTDLHYSAP